MIESQERWRDELCRSWVWMSGSDAGLSKSFEIKVGLHRGSVLSPLLFAAVMDVVSSETRSDLPSCCMLMT